MFQNYNWFFSPVVVISDFTYNCSWLKLRLKLMIVEVFACKMLKEYYIISFLVIKCTVFIYTERLLKELALMLILNLKSHTSILVIPISNLEWTFWAFVIQLSTSRMLRSWWYGLPKLHSTNSYKRHTSCYLWNVNTFYQYYS